MDSRIDRRTALIGLSGAILAACGGGGDAIPSPPPASITAPLPVPPPPLVFAPGDLVPGTVAAAWSATATETLLNEATARPLALLPVEQPRILRAAFHAAFDAGSYITAVYRPQGHYYTWPANPEAAMGSAVHGVLRTLLPGQSGTLDAAFARAMTGVPDGIAKVLGIKLGLDAARRALDWAAADGSANAEGSYTPGTMPGDYQPTEAGSIARFVNWSQARPESIASAFQFRPPPPYALTDPAYAADLLEIKRLGVAIGSERTPEQTEIALFWQQSTPLAWQRIAADVLGYARLGGNPGSEATVLFQVYAGMQMRMADAYLAALESKYHYNFWRPITAIRHADSDGNGHTVADPTWLPLVPTTPPVPEHVSADAAASIAAASVINGHSGRARISTISCMSTSLPEVTRTFSDVSAIAVEIGLSRIYAGHNFRHSVEEGWALGRRISAYNPEQ